MVLRGTHSSTALVVVGCLFLIWDIYVLAIHKKNTQISNKPARMKSAGIMLIVASSIAIVTNVFSLTGLLNMPYEMFFVLSPLFLYAFLFVPSMLLLMVGIFLLSDKTINKTAEKRKYAFLLLLASVLLSLILNSFFLKYSFEWRLAVRSSIIILLNLSLALLSICALYFNQKKTLLRSAVVLITTFAIVSLLWNIYVFILFTEIFDSRYDHHNIIQSIFPLLSGIFLLVAYIVLAAAFYPRKEQSAVIESSSEVRQKFETAATSNDSNAGITETQTQSKIRSLGKEVKGQYTYEYYAASSAEEAKQFLASREVTQSFYYIQVETPAEGVWGLDKDGLYLVNLLPFQKNLLLAQCEGSYTQFPFSAIVMASKGISDNFVSNIICGSCGHEWKDALRVKSKTIVKCPKCKKYNSVDTYNINVL